MAPREFRRLRSARGSRGNLGKPLGPAQAACTAFVPRRDDPVPCGRMLISTSHRWSTRFPTARIRRSVAPVRSRWLACSASRPIIARASMVVSPFADLESNARATIKRRRVAARHAARRMAADCLRRMVRVPTAVRRLRRHGVTLEVLAVVVDRALGAVRGGLRARGLSCRQSCRRRPNGRSIETRRW